MSFKKITSEEILERKQDESYRLHLAMEKAKQAFRTQMDVTISHMQEIVKELKSIEADEINHQGIDAQLKYIVEKGGVKLLEDIVGS